GSKPRPKAKTGDNEQSTDNKAEKSETRQSKQSRPQRSRGNRSANRSNRSGNRQTSTTRADKAESGTSTSGESEKQPARQEKPRSAKPREKVTDQKNTAEKNTKNSEPVTQSIDAGGDSNVRPEPVATVNPDASVKKAEAREAPVKAVEVSASTPIEPVKQDLPPPAVQKPKETVSESSTEET
ncbi:MAG: hypothetical protein ACC663_07990, partial [Gammaproteobacteria bacterium]